ncbi:hypothetical protein D3C87_1625690 [compost metagenome]
MPPLTSAAPATAVCSGVVETPWPKEMVIELIFFHSRGWLGDFTSGSSVGSFESRPMRVKNSLWPGMPMRSAILAVPMFDEYWKISGTVSTRRLP